VPTYQYACTSCGHNLEAVQSFSDDPLTTCPACEGKLRKLFSSVGIVFKGSGFYRTDSRTPAPAAKGANGSSTETSSTPASSSGSGSDSGSSSGSGSASGSTPSGSGTGGSSGGASSSGGGAKQPAATAA